jgi:DNA-binding NarL/FixJ family response regulator
VVRGARRLTKRELEVLDLLGEGLRHEDIARRLFISPKTVATHVEHILRKLDVRSRAEAIAVAYREDILQPPTPLESRGSPTRASRNRPA